MGIDISALGPDARRQVMKQISEARLKKGSKYHNEKTVVNGIRFDSRKEANRYIVLKSELASGAISDLKLQPQFTIQESYKTAEGKRVQAIRYVADFSYTRDGVFIVEDVKSEATKTRVYGLKKKLVRERFGVEITEI